MLTCHAAVIRLVWPSPPSKSRLTSPWLSKDSRRTILIVYRVLPPAVSSRNIREFRPPICSLLTNVVRCFSIFVTKPLSTIPLAVPRPINEGLDLLHKTPALYQLGISTPITSDASPSIIAKGFLPEGWTEDTELQVQDMSQLPKALVEGT